MVYVLLHPLRQLLDVRTEVVVVVVVEVLKSRWRFNGAV